MAQSTAIPGQFDLTAPAQRFTQGGRDVYSFILHIPEVDRLLPVRLEEGIAKAEGANRPLSPPHVKEIQEYLEKQGKWVFGTLLLGIDPAEVEFDPWQDTSQAVVAGQLRIRAGSALKIFDGQHRRHAIKDALESLKRNRNNSRLASLNGESLPIMLYAEPSIDALRQMFADAAQTKPIERNASAQFDWNNAFNVAADQLLAISEFLGGRVEMQRPSVARNNTNIISINQLSETLKILDVGINGRLSKERNNEHLANVGDLVDKFWVWSDEFMPAARQEYEDLLSGEIDNEDIPGLRSDSMAYNATVIQILAGCYYEWVKGDPDWQPLAEFIRSASLKPGSGAGALLVDAGAVIPGGRTPMARKGKMSETVDYIVRQAKIANE